MVLISTITTKLNRILAPKILKYSLKARYALSLNKPIILDNPYLDSMFLIPLSQKLISIEAQHLAKELIDDDKNNDDNEKKRKSAMDEFVDRIWDRYLEPISPSNDISPHQNLVNNNDPPRLKAFTKYIRQVLTPNNRFQDINNWRFNNRFVKWLRSEYLICKYEHEIRSILQSHSKLQHCAILSQKRSKIRDVMRYGLNASIDSGAGDDQYSIQYSKSLPTYNAINDAFQMHNWNKDKVTNDEEYKQMKHVCTNILKGTIYTVPGTNIQIANVSDETSVANLTLEEILEVAGCHVSNCNAFNALCDDANIYEFWNEEYVRSLSNYLMERCQELHNQDDKDVVIVDVGAGDGILAQYLREKMIIERNFVGQQGKLRQKPQSKNQLKTKNQSKRKNTVCIPSIVATDDGSWSIQPKANVEKMSVNEAMTKYSPHQGKSKNSEKFKDHHLIILCSWMPMGVDWTKLFRNAGVDEYILIGESDDGNCGHNWHTWGNPEFFEGNDVIVDEKGVVNRNLIPDYALSGYKRNDLEDLSKLQFSRFDSKVSSGSKTISFRKICDS